MQLNIDPRWRGLRDWRPDWRSLAILRYLLVFLVLLQAARMVWSLVVPLGAFGDWRPQPAMSRDAAAGTLTGFDPFFRLEQPVAAAPTGVVTSLQLVLFGIRVDEASGRGSAIIATPDGQQKSYSVGDEIMPGVTLKQVAFDHVTLDRNGASEDLFIDQSQPAAPVAPGDAGAPPAPMVDTPSVAPPPPPAATAPRESSFTPAEISGGVGFIPRIDGGRVTGLVVRPQGGSDVFQRVGFRNGDVITKVNGRPVSGADDMRSIAAGMANGGNLSVSVERGAEILPLVISVKGS